MEFSIWHSSYGLGYLADEIAKLCLIDGSMGQVAEQQVLSHRASSHRYPHELATGRMLFPVFLHLEGEALAGLNEREAVRDGAPLSAYRLFVKGGLLDRKVPWRRMQTASGESANLLCFFTPMMARLTLSSTWPITALQGWVRSEVEIGQASFMQSYGMRYLALDVFSWG